MSRSAVAQPHAALLLPRRRFLKFLSGSLLAPALLRDGSLPAADFVSRNLSPEQLWDHDRQLVFAYKQGETLGEFCQKLDAVKDELPVSILWRLPPEWVKVFPTIHFEVSSRRWKKYESWQDAAAFTHYYEQFNPPPKTSEDISPYKQYAANFQGEAWTYPGEIADHLLDPQSMHRFSEYELRGLTKGEMENLHSAHHEELVEPGRRPPVAGVGWGGGCGGPQKHPKKFFV
jgi:hypothetical protein